MFLGFVGGGVARERVFFKARKHGRSYSEPSRGDFGGSSHREKNREKKSHLDFCYGMLMLYLLKRIIFKASRENLKM